MAGLGDCILPEGNSFTRPPSFNGNHYTYWKSKMRLFLDAVDIDLWDIVENGPYTPLKVVDGVEVQIPRNEWSDSERRLFN